MNAAPVVHVSSPKRRGPGRPRGTVGPVRAALMHALREGVCGSIDALAAHTGWPPESVRVAMKHMVRARAVPPPARAPRRGRGAAPGLYALGCAAAAGSASAAGLHAGGHGKAVVNALAFAQQVWR